MYPLPLSRWTARLSAKDESFMVDMYTGTSYLYAAATKLLSGCFAFSALIFSHHVAEFLRW